MDSKQESIWIPVILPIASSNMFLIFLADPSNTQSFQLRSFSDSVETQIFYLGSHLKPKLDSYEPFQYYHRLSGSTLYTPYIAVDVDFHTDKWRIIKLNESDSVNEWTAYKRNIAVKSRKGLAQLPSPGKFHPISEEQLMNGTFTNVHPESKHMHIPELKLAIANLDGFFSNYQIEPFLRVFNTRGLDDDEAKRMLDDPWDNLPNKRVVMRTAAFGHGRSRLSMCIKEGTLREMLSLTLDDGQGISNEMLVPFAIISALRNRVNETEIRSTRLGGR